ncbi:glyoxalase/bleomycin resistance protein/dioxygenase superfamily protein [Nonomuraea polychroma]|uniref:Glyoxalase/bleomycin resistance protein/dioxygenase superfamily protein n=1 Tax=Nonomuraea polychroma TaxID=46176 RepID=A0A438MHA8_9ACTN|nr:glyoxalase/bleomycin resistance protein/dioxygenase superfamily protein [Nonomuraea polychroma]
MPDADGRPVFVILERGEARLLVDALQGMPFPDTEREQRIQRGPRGLGAAIGLHVDDLEAVYAYCLSNGCEITCEPMKEAWGDRIFECLDPFGYLWEFFNPSQDQELAAGLAATRDAWFGERA